ncbi:hypothetical protein MTO96_050189, partial [Rhipicephalus appendiculatus]
MTALLYTMGRQARKFFQTFDLTIEQLQSDGIAMKKFDAHFVANKIRIYESVNFDHWRQEHAESVDFAMPLVVLGHRCQFKEFRERLICRTKGHIDYAGMFYTSELVTNGLKQDRAQPNCLRAWLKETGGWVMNYTLIFSDYKDCLLFRVPNMLD